MRNDSPRRSPGAKRTTSSKPGSRRPASGRSTTKSTWTHRPRRTPTSGTATDGQGNTRSADSVRSQRPPKKIISPREKSVMFSLTSPDSKDVAIVGAFNNWEPETMQRGPDGVWRITVQLAHGTYEYRFLVDGVWMQDANNPRRQANDVGGYNSVCNVL